MAFLKRKNGGEISKRSKFFEKHDMKRKIEKKKISALKTILGHSVREKLFSRTPCGKKVFHARSAEEWYFPHAKSVRENAFSARSKENDFMGFLIFNWLDANANGISTVSLKIGPKSNV